MKYRIIIENGGFFIGTKPKRQVFIDCVGVWFRDEEWSINKIKHCNEPELIKALNVLRLLGYERSKLINSQELAEIMSKGLEYYIPNGVMIMIAIKCGLPTYYDQDLLALPEFYDMDNDDWAHSAWIDLSFDANRCNFAG